MSTVRKAVIPVAGLGTRVLPASKAIPKEMLPVVDKPVIQHVVEEAVKAGIKEIILVTRSGKSSIEDHFDSNYELEQQLELKNKTAILNSVRNIIPKDVTIVSVRQPEAKGLGHAVHCAAQIVNNEPFVVILPDVLVNNYQQDENDLQKMVSAFEQHQAAQIMVESVPQSQVQLYGITDCNGIKPAAGESAPIKGMVEKPKADEAPSDLAVVGRYVLPARVMDLLANTKPGAGDEIQLTDALDELLQEQTVEAYRMTGKTYDCGNKLGFLKANVAYGLQHPDTAEGFKQFLAQQD
ncbi:UTP--glucose-1-phosphate uridylyltransferase GalU [Amphritea sp. 2_MG-2023]|uniref:UTP--glucose-1-phosphate uridylyltransferase GalU n=1 Tax=Amphritea TaxID=515417 RepID=UPI001C067F91|nr:MULTISPECIES: UTP--glucose-1-phosphate uridylyltransferase GalU [Amphritea]MBU2965224.1 UTP--glucose-1-phosphate uridylyltransferase GalU [Amphritea atlantica]MDO6419707.1 UTP--glucose-1-phosphate uridylyltransferase GalU [Amphritea sp. 2_MG-2023]